MPPKRSGVAANVLEKHEQFSVAKILKELDLRCRLLRRLIDRPSGLRQELAAVQELVRNAIVLERLDRKRRIKPPSLPLKEPKKTLADALAEIMAGKDKITTYEAVKAMLAAGHLKMTKYPRDAVNHILRSNPRFKKVGRSEYALAAPDTAPED